jgi:hypothetical protein
MNSLAFGRRFFFSFVAIFRGKRFAFWRQVWGDHLYVQPEDYVEERK